MCQALRSLDADVLLLGGDYRGRNGGDVAQLFQALKTVETPCGTYAVMGNHERGQADSLARKAIQETGNWGTFTGARSGYLVERKGIHFAVRHP